MKDKIITICKGLFAKGDRVDNDAAIIDHGAQGEQEEAVSNINIRLKQFRLLIAIVLVILLIVGSLSLFISKKVEIKRQANVEPEAVLKVELADKNLDPEKHWRNYFEDRQERISKEVAQKLQELSEDQKALLQRTNDRIAEELAETKEKLTMAQRELSSASLDLQRVAKEEQKRVMQPVYNEHELKEQDFEKEIDFDRPKSVKNYIPEGTYFTGHLLGGVAVSTALNSPDENATPVILKLAARLDAKGLATTNLSNLNQLKLQDCRIMGSAYGDLSSERAIIRLEKMICEQNGTYITSKIAGQIFGPDGLNGVKGTIISTSSKHIKNAALGGLISGLGAAAKGQDSSTVTAGGLVQTKGKNATSIMGDGLLQGTSNAGDKIADYYLRQAEAMSPILTVPSGVRINAQITKGFFVGEVSTHKRIKASRTINDNGTNNKSEYTE